MTLARVSPHVTQFNYSRSPFLFLRGKDNRKKFKCYHFQTTQQVWLRHSSINRCITLVQKNKWHRFAHTDV